MKGTFFSADFVTDKDDNYRLIEINTDTGIVQSQAYIFDWTDFIGVLSGSNITDVEVIYKYDIQHPIVNHLSASLAVNAPFITSFTPTVVATDSIFPPSSTDADNKFILRMAYDESAILDSEYAKGILNLLTLFANAGDTGSVCNFYHSSSLHGEYDTLDRNLFNGDLLPDMVGKPLSETHRGHVFYKIGHSESGSVDRYNNFIEAVSPSNFVLEQYHIPQSQIDGGVVKSTRSFCIVYGPNLDLCYAAEYDIESVLALPTGSIVFDDSKVDNKLETKHYYEYATNTIKNVNHGILENEDILDINNQPVLIKDMVLGNSYLSYFISGSPNTDDYEVLRGWTYEGNTLPSGSYLTSSTLIGLYEDVTYANDLTEIIFESGDKVIIGGEARMLVHNKNTNVTSYQRVVDLTTDYSVFGMNETTNSIVELNLNIYDEQQPVYTMNMEDVDNFILASGNFVSFFVVHNLTGGSCFIAGTKILMADGTEKNIEDVVEGDEVISFNESTLQNEVKKVIGLKTPIHNDLVRYEFANQTSVTSTFDHPFYVGDLELASFAPFLTNKRYEIGKEVRQIKVGDLVYLPTNKSKTAIKDIIELDSNDTQTYIITVEDNHNFYANNILVHNK
jgi:hypothetical protein